MEIAVIGRGLIGSAAAKYLARAGHSVVLIGPSEPEDKANHSGVFASHYDEGRITRQLDPDPFWSEVSTASIARYRQIEAESGQAFFSETGALMGGPDGSDAMRAVARINADRNIGARRLSGAALAEAFPYFHFDPEMVVFHEADRSGHISPRKLVRAQTVLAETAGATLLDDYVVEPPQNARRWTVTTTGQSLAVDCVLVATGAFTPMILPDLKTLSINARTVAFFEIDAAEQERLAGMPSLVVRNRDGSDPYLLPPITYPNGRTYLKLGGDPDDLKLHSADEMTAWFRTSGRPEVAKLLMTQIEARMPGLRIEAMHSEACATTFTPDYRPDIGALGEGLFTAVGGCGAGAKCSDELGRRAAEAVLRG